MFLPTTRRAESLLVSQRVQTNTRFDQFQSCSVCNLYGNGEFDFLQCLHFISSSCSLLLHFRGAPLNTSCTNLKPGEVILEAGEALDELDLLLLARRQRLLDVLQLGLQDKISRLYTALNNNYAQYSGVYFGEYSVQLCTRLLAWMARTSDSVRLWQPESVDEKRALTLFR